MRSQKRSLQSGFTLIEVLVVIALISILSAITYIALNPAKHFADARNTQRSSDVRETMNAVSQYISEPGHAVADLGAIPACTSPAALGTDVGNIDLSTLLVDSYIVSIPQDPSVGTALDTGYTICAGTNNRITIAAPHAERGKIIGVKR